MNKTLTALATAAAVVIASPAQARSNHQAHIALSRAVQRAGITVHVNHKVCDKSDALGMYIAKYKSIVICQQNRVKGSTTIVRWTEEDYDTLRHEVHHVVQDCMDSTYNGELDSVYKEPISLAKNTLSTRKINWIIDTYRQHGATDHIVVMELEAFSVAALNDPQEQIQDINRYCF